MDVQLTPRSSGFRAPHDFLMRVLNTATQMTPVQMPKGAHPRCGALLSLPLDGDLVWRTHVTVAGIEDSGLVAWE